MVIINQEKPVTTGTFLARNYLLYLNMFEMSVQKPQIILKVSASILTIVL